MAAVRAGIFKQGTFLLHHPVYLYRLSHLLVDCVRLNCLPDSAWADGNLAEVAGQLGKMVVEHPYQSQPNPGLRADGTLCIYV